MSSSLSTKVSAALLYFQGARLGPMKLKIARAHRAPRSHTPANTLLGSDFSRAVSLGRKSIFVLFLCSQMLLAFCQKQRVMLGSAEPLVAKMPSKVHAKTKTLHTASRLSFDDDLFVNMCPPC